MELDDKIVHSTGEFLQSHVSIQVKSQQRRLRGRRHEISFNINGLYHILSGIEGS